MGSVQSALFVPSLRATRLFRFRASVRRAAGAVPGHEGALLDQGAVWRAHAVPSSSFLWEKKRGARGLSPTSNNPIALISSVTDPEGQAWDFGP